MSAFATLAAVERRLYLDQVATRLGVAPVIVEYAPVWVLVAVAVRPATPAALMALTLE